MLNAGNTIVIQIVTILEVRKDTGYVIRKNFGRMMSSENCIILSAE